MDLNVGSVYRASNAFVSNFKCSSSSTSLLPYRTSNKGDSSTFGENSPHLGLKKYRATHLDARKKYTHVQVTLERDTPNVGKKGEIVYVTQNYAFNYLVPFGFARYTTRSELVGLALDRNYKECLQNIRRTSALQLKEKLGKELVVEFEVPSSNADKSKLNAPLRPVHIIYKLRNMKLLGPLDMLREQDIKIHTESGCISKYGTFNVTLVLDENIESSIKVKVQDIPVDVIIKNDQMQI
ncbi:50S ribosomal protein L9 [Theileria orientalis]|uniref:50S ribosomal protein L9 n=1 Tax=Theileria orientalis TaxID=68886 RepID=A0A976SJB5_THEOR|nr:50S ribosomal protein L9 [Theileria orientalis]